MLLLAILIAALIVLAENKVVAVVFGSAAALALLVKEVLSAFAHDNGFANHVKKLEGRAAVASLYSVVFGVPAAWTAIAAITNT